jgi:hypothetical protein
MKSFKILLFLALILLGLNTAKADPPTLGAALNTVAKAYFDVKNSLVANNVSATQKSALQLITALNAVPDKSMTEGQHKFWFDYLNKLEYDSRHISESGVIDHQREHFGELSDNMYIVLKRFNLNIATLYKQYCPMKKLYWVSETTAIKNPYYGPGSMITCGTTKEELKPLKSK